MTITDTALRDQNIKRTFSYLLLVSASLTNSGTPQLEDFVSYQQAQHTPNSFGTLEVQKTFISDANVLEALVVPHENLLLNGAVLDGELLRLLCMDIEERYA